MKDLEKAQMISIDDVSQYKHISLNKMQKKEFIIVSDWKKFALLIHLTAATKPTVKMCRTFDTFITDADLIKIVKTLGMEIISMSLINNK